MYTFYDFNIYQTILDCEYEEIPVVFTSAYINILSKDILFSIKCPKKYKLKKRLRYKNNIKYFKECVLFFSVCVK